MRHIIDPDNPSIGAPLAEAAQLALEHKPDLDLDASILGYALAIE